MLFCTSLVAIVGIGDQPTMSPRRLRIMNTKRQSTICELTFPTSVLKVLLNRQRLVVVLEEQIYVYDISNMKLLQTIETAPNPKAVAALTPSSDNSYLIYPSGAPMSHSPPSNGNGAGAGGGVGSAPALQAAASPAGELKIFDCQTLRPVNIVSAHKGPVAVVAINNEGTLMATASSKGTIIRVFSIPSGKLLYQFRRGSRPSTVYSICFNSTSTLVCVSSASQTVHIFKLARSQDEPMTQLQQQQHQAQRSNSVSQQRKRSVSSSPEDRKLDSSNSTTTTSATNFPSIPHSDEENNIHDSEEHDEDHHGDQDDDDDDDGDVPKDFITQSKPQKQSRFGLEGYIEAKRQELGKQVAGYLPKGVADMWETKQRDFAFFKLPADHNTKSVVAMSKSSQYVYAVTSEGYFYQYLVNLVNGGECELLKQYSLTTSDD